MQDKVEVSFAEFPLDSYQLPIQSSDLRLINQKGINISPLYSSQTSCFQLLKQPLDIIFKQENIKPWNEHHNTSDQSKLNFQNLSLGSKQAFLYQRHLQSKSCITKIKRTYYKQKSPLTVTSFACTLCPKKYTRKYDLNKHCLVHTGSEPFKCHVCNKKFTQIQHYKKHTLTHMERSLETYVCLFCGKVFGQKCHLKRHYRVHTEETPFKCQTCEKGFCRKDTMLKHARRCFCLPAEEKPYKCHICCSSFAKEISLSMHSRKHAYTVQKALNNKVRRKKIYSCVICKEKFTEEPMLTRHYEIHTITYSCDICGNMFPNRTDFKLHSKLHNHSEKVFCDEFQPQFTSNVVCRMCDKTFRNKAELVLHGKIHNQRTYSVCCVCCSLINSDEELKAHCLKHVNYCYVDLKTSGCHDIPKS